MKALLSQPVFPNDLEPPAVRSLSLIFILQELVHLFPHDINLQKGVDKLCFYCDILLQASKIDPSSILQKLEAMHRSILPLRFSSQKSCNLKDLLCDFFSALVPFLQEARTDENVLIYLIEQAQILNRYLGERAIETILQSFFPEGHEHLRTVIYEGFTRRGFTSFLAEKEPLIAALDWESPCPSTPIAH